MEKLHHYCAEKQVHLLCYCLLSNHVHLLLETPRGNLSKLMQPFQTSYTVFFNRRHGRTGHVFEQRYKAFLVDKDNYLLQVSRYIHLNPVEAQLVERPQDYRWSSYGGYLGEKGEKGLNRELILGQFGRKGQQAVARYREFVEGALKRGEKWAQLPLIKQEFVGDEDFAERARSKAKKHNVIEGRYGLGAIVRQVCKVVEIDPEELTTAPKQERVERGRELFMYIARRHSEASLREIVSWLGVRDPSTVSHGVRRAEVRLKEEKEFRREVEAVLTSLAHSRIQA